MTIDALIRSITRSDFYRSEVASNCQIGLPQFFMHQNRLCVRFFPHVQKLDENGNMLFYSPEYHLSLMQPFRHLLQFCSLKRWHQSENMPLCVVATNLFLQYQEQLKALFKTADKLLNADGEEQTALLQTYIRQFDDVVSSLGIEKVYGGKNDSDRCL